MEFVRQLSSHFIIHEPIRYRENRRNSIKFEKLCIQCENVVVDLTFEVVKRERWGRQVLKLWQV